jgi:small-conductance mechanosensitive channel
MAFRRRSTGFLLAALAGLLTACVSPSGPQPAAGAAPPAQAGAGSPESVAPAAAAPKEIVALAQVDVPRAAIAATTRIRSIRSLAARTLGTDAIAGPAERVLASVEALKEWMRSREPRQQTARALGSLSQEWFVDGKALGIWMDKTSRRLDALSAADAELQRLDELWAKTIENLDAFDAPIALRQSARDILRSTREVEATVSAEIEKVLLLQSRISAAKLDSEEALDKIAAALREERKSLYKIESPPIWKLTRQEAEGWTLAGELNATTAEAGRALTQYVGDAPGRIWFQLAVFIALIFAFHRLRPRSRAWPADDRGLRACARLVDRPVLGAALVAILCGLWIHPRAPLGFYEISSLLLIVPVVFLLWGIVRPELRGALCATAVTFAIERMWETTRPDTILERVVLLFLTVLAAVVIVWAFRPRTPHPDFAARRWWRAATVVARVGLVALAVSFVSNLVGNATLARFLTTTVVRVGYAGIVLFAAALILRGTTALFVRWAAAHSFHTLERHGDVIVRRSGIVIDVLMVLLFPIWTLKTSGLIPVARETVIEALTNEWGIGTIRFSLGSALVLVAAIYSSILVSRLICTLLEEDMYPRVSLPRGIPATMTMLVRYGVISIGFFLALSIAGIPLDRLTIILGAFSVGIGFGLQTAVNNFVSGLILLFERPIQIGDAVEVSGLVGRVRRIGVRASTIETFDGAEVIVPNGTLVSNQLINWTLTSRSRRIEIQVGVAYGTDPEKVLALLPEATKGLPGVLANPAPNALFRGFGASSLDFSVLFWTADFETWTKVKSDASVTLNRVLAEAGIVIPFPQHDVHIRREAVEEP